MDIAQGAITPRDVMLAHWLAIVPGHLQLLARIDRWDKRADQLDERLGHYGMGRN